MKRMRQDKKRRARNQAVKSAVRGSVRKADSAGSAEEAGELLKQASSVIDRAAKKGVIHWRTAARKKSRLAKRVGSRSS
jgi:small subunit ribosomal protein S20